MQTRKKMIKKSVHFPQPINMWSPRESRHSCRNTRDILVHVMNKQKQGLT